MSQHLYVFGSNGEGQLGIPAAEIVDTPTLVVDTPPLGGLRYISGGDNHTLLMINQGEMYGVGDNRKGQLVPGMRQESHLHTFEKLHSDVVFTAATCESSAYITVHPSPGHSSVHTQGSGQWGELGCGEDVTSVSAVGSERLPFHASLPGRVIEFAAGAWHYVAVLEDGSVYGWGKARLGQLGEKLSGKVDSPTRVEEIPFRPTKVVCGKDFTYLVGHPSTGEHIVLGKDKFNISSGKPDNIQGWKDIGATWHAIFILFNNGKLAAWGRNALWELLPPGLPLIDKIAVGSEHVLAVTKEGKLISWGWGKHGNCGDMSNSQERIKNDMISGFWNEVDISGTIDFIGAGFCTSFVVTKQPE
jgi:protein ATS1